MESTKQTKKILIISDPNFSDFNYFDESINDENSYYFSKEFNNNKKLYQHFSETYHKIIRIEHYRDIDDIFVFVSKKNNKTPENEELKDTPKKYFISSKSHKKFMNFRDIPKEKIDKTYHKMGLGLDSTKNTLPPNPHNAFKNLKKKAKDKRQRKRQQQRKRQRTRSTHSNSSTSTKSLPKMKKENSFTIEAYD